MSEKLTSIVETTAGYWSDVVPPSRAGVEFAGQLQSTHDGFVALRGSLRFEDEPAGFEAALQAVKEPS